MNRSKKLIDLLEKNIPNDLVILPGLEGVPDDDADVKLIMDADWYVATNKKRSKYEVLLASAREIEFLSEDDIEDATGEPLKNWQIERLPDSLKKYDPDDGFYFS